MTCMGSRVTNLHVTRVILFPINTKIYISSVSYKSNNSPDRIVVYFLHFAYTDRKYMYLQTLRITCFANFIEQIDRSACRISRP